MSAELMRSYLDILNEQQQQLDEGMIQDLAAKAANWVASKFGKDIKAIADTVRKATGGDATPSKENAAKVMQALGITPQDIGNLVKQAKADQSNQQMAENFLAEASTKDIILRIVWALLSAGFLNLAIKSSFGWNIAVPFSTFEGIWAMVGMIILMVSGAFWQDSEPSGGVPRKPVSQNKTDQIQK